MDKGKDRKKVIGYSGGDDVNLWSDKQLDGQMTRWVDSSRYRQMIRQMDRQIGDQMSELIDWASPVAQTVKNLPAMQKTLV